MQCAAMSIWVGGCSTARPARICRTYLREARVTNSFHRGSSVLVVNTEDIGGALFCVQKKKCIVA